MLLLALDTSTAQVSVAFGDGGAVLGSVQLAGGRRHAEQLAPAIEYLRGECGVGPRPPRRHRGGHGPGPLHRPAGRRHHRQGDGAGAAHPGGRRAQPRPGGVPAAPLRAHDRRGARRPSRARCSPPATSRCPVVCSGCPTTRCTRRPSWWPTSRPTRPSSPTDCCSRATASRGSPPSSPSSTTPRWPGPEFAAPSVAALVALGDGARRARGVRATGRPAPALPPPERRRDRVGPNGAAWWLTEWPREPDIAALDRARAADAPPPPAVGAAHRAAGVPAAVELVAVHVGARAAARRARTSSRASDATSSGTRG